MIRRLALAQLQANKIYLVWTTALMTLLVGILTFVVAVGATQADLERHSVSLRDGDLPRFGGVGVRPDGTEPTRNEGFEAELSFSELTALIAQANAGARTAVASAGVYLLPSVPATDPAVGMDYFESFPDLIAVEARAGASASESLMREGEYPRNRGEIALAIDVARRLDVGVGDRLTLYREVYNTEDPVSDNWSYTYTPVEFEVVGITAAASMPGYAFFLPGGYVSWAEVGAVDSTLGFAWVDEEGVSRTATYVTLAWGGPDPRLDHYLTEETYEYSVGDVTLPMWNAPWINTAIALVIAMTVMAFAVGRSQAAARTQWVATARTVGATRRHIVNAALAETLIMAGTALAVGGVLGAGAAQAHLSAARALATYPVGSAVISLSWWIVPVVLGSVLLVAVPITAVPAFWAARVAPTAALKPVSDVTEAEVSRRVRARWLAVPFGLGLLLTLVAAFSEDWALKSIGAVLGPVALFVSGLAIVVEGTRRLVSLTGRRLARRGGPARIVAGDALVARPRQATAPALMLATVAAIAMVTATISASGYTQMWISGLQWVQQDPASPAPVLSGERLLRQWAASMTTGSTLATVVIIGLTIQLVAVAVFSSHRSATAHEGAAQRALGLSARDQRLAFWWQQWAPQALGVLIGMIVGLGVYLLVELLNRQNLDHWVRGTMSSLGGTGLAIAGGLMAALVVGAAMLALGAGVAWLSARLQVPVTPVAALAPRQ